MSVDPRALGRERRKGIYEVRHPEVRNGGDRKSEGVKSDCQNGELVDRFSLDAAKNAGLSERPSSDRSGGWPIPKAFFATSTHALISSSTVVQQW